MMKNVSVRLGEQQLIEIEELARLEKTDKSALVREALEEGLETIREKIAIDLFTKQKLSTSEAAYLAQMSVGEFMDELSLKGIDSGITLEDLKFGELVVADIIN